MFDEIIEFLDGHKLIILIILIVIMSGLLLRYMLRQWLQDPRLSMYESIISEFEPEDILQNYEKSISLYKPSMSETSEKLCDDKYLIMTENIMNNRNLLGNKEIKFPKWYIKIDDLYEKLQDSKIINLLENNKSDLTFENNYPLMHSISNNPPRIGVTRFLLSQENVRKSLSKRDIEIIMDILFCLNNKIKQDLEKESKTIGHSKKFRTPHTTTTPQLFTFHAINDFLNEFSEDGEYGDLYQNATDN